MKRVLLIVAVVAAIVAAFTAGRLEGIRHLTQDSNAWLESDETGCTGFMILDLDGTEYKVAVF